MNAVGSPLILLALLGSPASGAPDEGDEEEQVCHASSAGRNETPWPWRTLVVGTKIACPRLAWAESFGARGDILAEIDDATPQDVPANYDDEAVILRPKGSGLVRVAAIPLNVWRGHGGAGCEADALRRRYRLAGEPVFAVRTRCTGNFGQIGSEGIDLYLFGGDRLRLILHHSGPACETRPGLLPVVRRGSVSSVSLPDCARTPPGTLRWDWSPQARVLRPATGNRTRPARPDGGSPRCLARGEVTTRPGDCCRGVSVGTVCE